jgi:hypothetical protein
VIKRSLCSHIVSCTVTAARFTCQSSALEGGALQVVLGTLEHGREHAALKVDEPILHRGVCMRTIVRHEYIRQHGNRNTKRVDRSQHRGPKVIEHKHGLRSLSFSHGVVTTTSESWIGFPMGE